jgi:hypothetical protein
MHYLFTALALFFTFFTTKNFVEQQWLLYNGEWVSTSDRIFIIVDKYKDRQEKYYHIMISYTTQQGELVKVVYPNKIKDSNLYKERTFNICYDPANPKNVLIEGAYSKYGKWVFWYTVSLLFIMGAIFFWRVAINK